MGRARTFTGRFLNQIRFPIGGLGTGCVSLAGRGSLTDFEWWNHPAKGYDLPYTFFAVTVRSGSRRVSSRVLAALPPDPLDAHGFGLPRAQGQGLPHFTKAVFRGEYPIATVRLTDPGFPVAAELEGWNPLLPLEPEDSGLPIAILHYRLRNRTARRLQATLVGSLFNAVGLDGREVPYQNRHGALGGNRNRVVHGPRGLVGLHMTRESEGVGSPRAGSLFLGLLGAQDPSVLTRWPQGAWFDDLQQFWDGFQGAGRLWDEMDDGPSPPGVSSPGSLADTVVLPARSGRDVVFLLAWYFPNFENWWNADEPRVAGRSLRTHYARRFGSAFDVAAYAALEFPRLQRTTRQFRDAFFAQSHPPEILDAASRPISTLRSPTCLWLDTGRFHAFEGCLDRVGCCPMDCTHVWNYAQGLPHLWPSLERTLRSTALEANLFADGRQAFRSLLPLEAGARFDRKPAADGQLGEILKLHRDWRLCGDTGWMTRLWPAARRALEYSFVQWDADHDGLLEGEQHVTYDIELYGPNPLTGVLYLAALRAGAALARAAGEDVAARRYDHLAQAGARRFDETCWNGSWYVQRIPPRERIRPDPHPTGSLGGSLDGVGPDEPPRYQFGEGCLSDQLLGEWMARACGLGPVLPPRRVRRALRSVVRHNFRPSLREHSNAQRIYAVGDEPGLLLCSWPRGGRPALPFPYADEVWTGVEYQVAAHCLWEGLLDEGIELLRGVRSRFDGLKRNPWDETECGHHYARALASWSLLHAASGFRWDGVEERMEFAPRFSPRRFRTLFTAASGWGSFEQRFARGQLAVSLRVQGGQLRIRSLVLEWPQAPGPARVRLRDAPEGMRLRHRGRRLELSFPGSRALDDGTVLTLALRG